MTLPNLATTDDVAAILGRSLTSAETTSATRLLAMASGQVRRYTRQTLSLVTDDSVVLPGNWGHVLVLPQRPVSSVTSVTFSNGIAPTTQWKLVNDSLFLGTGAYMPDYSGSIWGGQALWGPAGSNNAPQATGSTWQGPQTQITVVYTHGYTDIPQDIVNEVAGMVAMQLNTDVGVQSEQIGGYKVVYDRAQSGAMVLSEEAKSVLNFYRVRAVSSSVAGLR
jgi:hypothetical protein